MPLETSNNNTPAPVLAQPIMATTLAPSSRSLGDSNTDYDKSDVPSVAMSETASQVASEKRDHPSLEKPTPAHVDNDDDDDDIEYPTAWKLVLVSIALCLAVFCMALVWSNRCRASSTIETDRKTGQHHYCDGNPANHRSIPSSRRCWLVWKCLLAHDMCFSAHVRKVL